MWWMPRIIGLSRVLAATIRKFTPRGNTPDLTGQDIAGRK